MLPFPKRIIIICLLFSAMFFTSTQLLHSQQIFINEFLASNVSVNPDIIDFDDYSDWIELYNAEAVDVDLSGYYLSDNDNEPMKWMIPSGCIIKKGETLLIWADGYDAGPGENHRRDEEPYNGFTTQRYHTNFKLSSAGEEIILSDREGNILDYINYEPQVSDVSKGRFPNGTGNWLYFGDPTPNELNNNDGVTDIQFSTKPTINAAGGFYQSSVVIEFSSSPEARIYYTRDGSIPNSNSLQITLPLTISETTTIRVRAYEEGKLPSKIVTETYLIDEAKNLPTISISAFPETLFEQPLGIYVNEMKGRDVPVTFEYFNVYDDTQFKVDAEMRISGQASYQYPQKPITVSVNDNFGYESIDYQIFKNRDVHSFTSLYLRNSGTSDNIHTHFRDAFQHSIIINQMDVDCQAYQPAATFINGEYWGVYNLREKVNADYIASHHNVDPNNLDYLEYDFASEPVVLEGDVTEYNNLLQYLNSHNLVIPEYYEHVKNKIDIDEYINYQIAQIFCDNINWPYTNIRWWRERVPNSKWRYIMLDLDYGFGNPDWNSHYTNNTLNLATSTPGYPFFADYFSTFIFRKLLQNRDFKAEFVQRFASYLNTTFKVERVVGILDSLENQLEVEMVKHIDRWKNAGPGYGGGMPIPDMNTWRNSVQIMREFALNRPNYMKQHISNYFSLGGTETLTTIVDNEARGSIIINGVKVPNNFTGEYFRILQVKIEAIPKPGYQFEKWIGLDDSTSSSIKIRLSETTEITAVFKSTQESILPNVITGNQVLTISNSPYIAASSVTVDSLSQLTIEPGVEVQMPAKTSLIVMGSLIIDGTEEEPVIFTNHSLSGAQTWGAIIFNEASGKSVLSNVKLINATNGSHPINEVGAISSYKSDIELHGVIIDDAPFPIFAQYGKFVATNCDLHSSKTCDMINVKYADSARIENNVFRGNHSFDTDAIDLDGVGYGLVEGNTIYNFFGFNSDGIDLGENSQNVTVSNNLIYNCNDKGISVGQASQVLVKRNIIVNCAQGVGVKDFNSYANVVNNTFYGCGYGVASFEKNIGAGGGNIEVINSIFMNSANYPYFVDELSILNIAYSLADNIELPGETNIQADPEFGNNFIPRIGSPLINSGDPKSELDSDGSRNDIGAKSYQQGTEQPIIINEISYAPASGDQFEFIELFNRSESTIDLSDYSLLINDENLYQFPVGFFIKSKEYIVIAADPSSLGDIQSEIYKWSGDNLPDEWGNISLNKEKTKVDLVTYSYSDFSSEFTASPYPLQLSEPGLENLYTFNWKLSIDLIGTPGLPNKSDYSNKIVINEFQANNTSTLADENGNYSDWIELYNISEEPVNLAGLYFTDDLSNPTRHKVPYAIDFETIIYPGQYLILWADGRPDLGPLHLNFRLNNDNEALAIVSVFDTDTTFVDSISFQDQGENFSYGRTSDGAAAWKEFKVPTPGNTNSLENAFQKGILLVNGISLNSADNVSAYSSKAFWGDYEIDFWDAYGNQTALYPFTLPEPIGFGAIDYELLMEYSTIIWISDASTSDINNWFQSFSGEYILNGGNILLMTRYASAFINSDYENGLGIKWISEGASSIENCTAVYEGLIDMDLTGGNFSNSVFDTLITNPNTKVLFQDRTNPDSTLNISFLYKPEYGGRYKEDGGSFVLIGGRPYRYDHSDIRTNVEYILQNFFNETNPTSVEENLIVTEYGIEQNYPNPFNPVTTIKYQLKEESKVSLKVFNILGQQVRELVNEIQPMGIYKTNFGGNDLASGVYFYEVHFTPTNGNKDFRSIKKMLLVK